MKRIIIVGIGCVTAKYLPESLRSAGYDPVFLLDLDNFAGPSRAALETCECHRVDIEDPGSVLKLLQEKSYIAGDADAVTGFFDEKFPLVRRIADEYGLASPSQVAVRLADKAEVVRLVPEYSPWAVTFRLDASTAPDLSPLADVAEVVLKPVLSSGALGFVRLVGKLDMDAVRAAAVATGLRDAGRQTWLLQECVDGRLVSLEGFAADGLVTFVGYSLRGRIGSTEVSNFFPADDQLPAEVRLRCERAVTALVDRSGFRDGYFHCEFLVGDDRAYLIDANMGRIGGASLAEQIALAHGLDPGDVLNHSLLLPLGGDAASTPPAYRPVAETLKTLSFSYGLRDGGVFRSITLPDDVSCRHSQFAVPGRRVPAVGVSDYAWVGMLTGSEAEALRDIDRIVIETDAGPMSPCYVRG